MKEFEGAEGVHGRTQRLGLKQELGGNPSSCIVLLRLLSFYEKIGSVFLSDLSMQVRSTGERKGGKDPPDSTVTSKR